MEVATRLKMAIYNYMYAVIQPIVLSDAKSFLNVSRPMAEFALVNVQRLGILFITTASPPPSVAKTPPPFIPQTLF